MDKNRLNSAKVDPKSLAAWLPVIIEALKGLKLKVKADAKAAYVSLGMDVQLAIKPTSESTGQYEKQVREGGKVTVEESGEYSNLKELIQLITQVKKTNSSKETPVVSNNGRRVLKAGRNLQESIGSQSLNSEWLQTNADYDNNLVCTMLYEGDCFEGTKIKDIRASIEKTLDLNRYQLNNVSAKNNGITVTASALDASDREALPSELNRCIKKILRTISGTNGGHLTSKEVVDGNVVEEQKINCSRSVRNTGQKTRAQRLFASRMQSLRASTPSSGDDGLATALSTAAGEIQEVHAVLFNSPGIGGEPVLNIAFHDSEDDVFVLQGMSEGSVSATFDSVEDLIDFAFGGSEIGSGEMVSGPVVNYPVGEEVLF